jgi:peptide/nickel transport system permease protein
VLAYAIGVPLGAWLSWRRGSRTDTAGIFFGLMFRSAPMFWTGMIAILIFGVWPLAHADLGDADAAL